MRGILLEVFAFMGKFLFQGFSLLIASEQGSFHFFCPFANLAKTVGNFLVEQQRPIQFDGFKLPQLKVEADDS